MKQFRLLLTLFALTMGWTNVSAQTWTGSEVGEGYALLYNVGTGQYFTRGNAYSTQASVGIEGAAMTVELKAVGDNYFIRTGVNNIAYGLEHLSGSVYTDQSRGKQSTWTFTQVGTNEDPVYNIVSADNHSGGEGTFLTVQDGTTIVGEGTDGTTDNAKWKVYLYTDQQNKLQNAMASATAENPVDVTAYILNHNFAAFKDYANEFWTMQSSNYNPNGGDITNPVAESWQAAFTLSQTISVPNGYYKLRAQGFIREYTETGTDYPVVYINEASKPFIKMVTETANLGIVSSYFTNGDNGEYYFTDWTDAVTVANKSITVGVKGTRTNSWCAWDNFQLQYLGPIDLTEYANQLAAAVASAEATEGTIPAGAYNAIDAVVTENNKTYGNEEDYIAAINAVNNAVSTYATADIVADYSRYKIVKAAALQAAPNTVVSDADAQVEAATTTNAIDEAIATLRQALITELPNVVIAEGNYLDLTNALIDNPTVSENVDYWNVENVGRPFDWSTGPTTNYGETEFYQSTFDFNQTLTLAKGTYEFGVTGFHRAGNHATYFYAGEDKVLIPGVESSVVNSMAEAKTYFDNGNGKVALKFALDNESNTLKIGIVNNDTETDRWTIFRNFTLKYFGSQIDLSSYEELLAAAVAAAEAVEGTVPSAVYQTLATVVSDNNQTYTTKDAYLTAIAAIEEATATAKAMQDPYNRYQLVKAAVVAISETISTSEADTQADAATTAEVIETAVSTVRAALSDYLANADIVDDHIDLTDALIDNPRPGITGTTDYWTNSSSPGLQHNLYEFYNVADATTKQTLATILPIGYYTLTVVGYTREGYDAFMSAGENKQTLIGVASDVVNDRNAGSAWIADGNGVNEMTFQLTEATADLEIGINTGKTGDKWTCWRSFKLEYLGTEPLSVFNDQLQTAIDAARTTANELDVPAGVATVLTSLATAYETEKANYTTAAQYTDAIAAIAAAVKAAESAVHPTVYNNLILQKAITTAALDKLADENEAALQAVIDANADALAACTNVEEIEARTTVLWTAIADALGTIELTGDETLNLTYLLTNPDLTNCPVWKGAEGWYTDQTDGNSQVMTNDAATSEDGTKTTFYEYWSNPAKANNLFTLYQKVTLPPGTFDISCYAFAQDQYAGQNSVGVYFYANDTQGSSVSNTKLSEASLSFINDTKQEVKIGLKTISSNTYNWMGIGYMELYMVAPNTTEYAINTDQVQNATVVATVDDKVVATALSLKNVTITVTPAEGFVVENVTVTYTEGEETKNVELSTTAMGAYTFQMPAFDVTVNVTTAKLATDAELTALTNALQPTAKLGFEKDDYAPYNNVESLTAAEAEIEKVYAEMEVFGGKATQATVVAATQVISQLNWTANTAEVNAFFDGSFASEYSHEGNVMPIGWHGVGDKDNATNVRLMWNVEGNAGLNATSSKQAAFAKFTAEYGTEVGYTLPLKAGVYDLKFIYGGWNEVGTRDIKVYNTENDAVVAPVTITAKDNQAHTTADSWSNYEGTVTIPADGNYVFSFYRENTTNQNQLVFSDITLYKAKAKKGDVNGDGNVDVADVTALVNAIKNEEVPAAGKIDSDNDVDADDVQALVNMILENNE